MLSKLRVALKNVERRGTDVNYIFTYCMDRSNFEASIRLKNVATRNIKIWKFETEILKQCYFNFYFKKENITDS